MVHEAPLFIVGVPRSGTTLLAHMLNRHRDIHVVRETHGGAFFRYHENMLRQFGLEGNARMWTSENVRRRFAETDPRLGKLCEDIRLQDGATLRDLLAEVIRNAASSHGAKVWADKCPRAVVEIPTLSYLFPNVKIVHLIRDGRAVAVSLRDRQDEHLEYAIHHWKRQIILARMDGAVLGPGQYLEVSFEKLVTAPEETLRKVLALVGLSFDKSMLLEERREADVSGRYVLPYLDSTKMLAWREKVTRDEVRRLESIAGDMLTAVGYDLLYQDPEGPFKAVSPWRVTSKREGKHFRRLFKGEFETKDGEDIIRVKISFSRRLSNFFRRSARNYLHPRVVEQFHSRRMMVD